MGGYSQRHTTNKCEIKLTLNHSFVVHRIYINGEDLLSALEINFLTPVKKNKCLGACSYSYRREQATSWTSRGQNNRRVEMSRLSYYTARKPPECKVKDIKCRQNRLRLCLSICKKWYFYIAKATWKLYLKVRVGTEIQMF